MEDFNNKSYSTSNKIKFFLKDKISYIIVVVGCLIFIFQDAIKWGFNDINIFVLLGSMAITYAFNITINFIFAKIGRKKGKDSDIFKSTMEYYANAKQGIEHIRNYLPLYCDYKTNQEKKRIQREILDDENLQLCKLDYYVQERLTEKQWECVLKARKVKVNRLQEKDLMSERGRSKKNKDSNYLGKSEFEFEKENQITNALTKLIIPIVLTYLSMEAFVLTNVLSGAVKVIIILMGGIFTMLANEDFAVNELRNRFINKADNLMEFKSLYDNDPVFKNLIKEKIIEDEKELAELKAIKENEILTEEQEEIKEININKVFEEAETKELKEQTQK